MTADHACVPALYATLNCHADEVLNELVSEASLEPHQEQANEPLSPAKPVSAFADRTVQEQVDGPKPEGTLDMPF